MRKFWLIGSLVIMLCLTACGSGSATTEPPAETGSATGEDVVEELPIYEDDLITVTFKGLSELDGIDATYLNLNVVNHGEQQITVYLKDGYVNDLMVTVGSGVPMTIEAGKQANNAFILMHGTSGDFPALVDITEVGFKLWVVDENTDTLLDTDTIVVTP